MWCAVEKVVALEGELEGYNFKSKGNSLLPDIYRSKTGHTANCDIAHAKLARNTALWMGLLNIQNKHIQLIKSRWTSSWSVSMASEHPVASAGSVVVMVVSWPN